MIKKSLLFGAVLSALTIDTFAVTKTVTTQGYVDTAVANKQNKLSGTNGYAVTYTGTAGSTSSRQIVTTLGTSTYATSLPTTGAVITGLNDKQNILNGPTNSVVTYTGTAGGTDSRGIYQTSGSYSSQTTSLVEANQVNTAVTNAFNALITCNTYATPGDTTSECLLWNVNTLSGTYMPGNP